MRCPLGDYGHDRSLLVEVRFDIVMIGFINNLKGVTFLFEVNWLSGLGVIGILKFLNGVGHFLPPFLKFLDKKKFQNKKLWWVTFLFKVHWLSGLGVIGIY